jgi:ComF family protein
MLIFTSLLDIVLPRTCAICAQASSSFVCGRCAKLLPRPDRPIVASPEAPYSLLAVPLAYRNNVRRLIHTFKYGGRPKAAAWFALIIDDFLNEYAIMSTRSFDLVTSVPMHGAKRRMRGFDQAEILARAIAARHQIPYVPLLTKTADLTSQTAKDRDHRFHSAASVYMATDLQQCHEARIMLVDDVFTSGATVSACAQALKDAGAADITVVAIAKGND